MTLRALFNEYAAIKDRSERLEFALAHLALIETDTLKSLQVEIKRDSWFSRRKSSRLVTELEGLGDLLRRKPTAYPIGIGPVEQVAAQVEQGVWSFDTALGHLTKPDIALHLTSTYADILVVDAEARVMREPEIAVLRTNLLAAACKAMGSQSQVSEVLALAAVGAIQITSVALAAIPNGEWLAAARELGDDIEKRMSGTKDNVRRAAVLHAMGALYSSAPSVTSGRDRAQPEGVHRSGIHVRIGAIQANMEMHNHPLPSDREMLEMSLPYFERALPDRDGHGRGITLKAIAQTLIVLSNTFGAYLEKARVKALCDEALEFSPPESENYRNVQMLLLYLKEVESKNIAVPETNTVIGVLQAASLFANSDPARALDILVNAARYFDEKCPEHHRRDRLHMMTGLIRPAFGGLDPDRLPTGVMNATKFLSEDPAAANLTPDQLAGTLFALARHTPAADEENLGLMLLTEAVKLSPRLTADNDAVAFLFATLASNAGANAFHAGDLDEAANAYIYSLAPSLHLNLAEMAFEVLARLTDIAGRLGNKGLQHMLVQVALHAFIVTERLGEPGVQALDSIYFESAASLQKGDGSTFYLLLRLAKGMLFDATLRSEAASDWRNDPQAVAMEQEISRQWATGGLQEAPRAMDDLLLVSAVETREALDGDAGGPRLHNLKQAFEKRHRQSFAKSISKPEIFAPSATPDLIGRRTVLLEYFYGAHADGNSAVYIAVCTAEATNLVINVLTDPKQHVVEYGRTKVLIGPIARRTFRLRGAIRKGIAGESIGKDARAALDEDFELLLGTPVWNLLRDLRRAGKDHLCIRPHQSLRYYPLALLGRDGLMLASDWIVTVLPSAECLIPITKPARTQTGTAALGLTYEDQARYSGIAPLTNARREVEQVAHAMSTAPLLDDVVTPKSFIAACRESRWVHLCAHGSQDAGAPSFHNVLLTPTQEDGGRLCAKDVIGQDFKGLELLTLGTCESALGRYDLGDNLSGLPAAFLAAGAQAIIATLWPIRDNVALKFFETLYAQLARGATRLDAFGKAQGIVRAEFPQAMDWAGFCYLGSWDTGVTLSPAGPPLHYELGRLTP